MDLGSLAGRGPRAGRVRRTTILVVADRVPVRRLIRRMLEFAGFKVIEAPDGMSSLSLLDIGAHLVDLVVTDFDLPAFRNDIAATLLCQRRPELPVLCLSGDPQVTAPPLPRGSITHFLKKPFSSDSLLRHIRALLAAAR